MKPSVLVSYPLDASALCFLRVSKQEVIDSSHDIEGQQTNYELPGTGFEKSTLTGSRISRRVAAEALTDGRGCQTVLGERKQFSRSSFLAAVSHAQGIQKILRIRWASDRSCSVLHVLAEVRVPVCHRLVRVAQPETDEILFPRREPFVVKQVLNERFRRATPEKYRISVSSNRLGFSIASHSVELGSTFE
jgi:hypothetical protein